MSSPNVEVYQGECTPAVNTVTPLVNASRMVRSVLIVPDTANVNPVKLGYHTSTPVIEAPMNLPPIAGKFYDLYKVKVKTSNAGDKVNYIATY